MGTLKNSVSLIGRLGKDVEVKQAGGSTVANVSLAVDASYKDKSGAKIEKTNWINLVMWGKTAEFAGKHLKKGLKVNVGGSLESRSYEGSDGETKYITEVRVDEIEMIEWAEKESA